MVEYYTPGIEEFHDGFEYYFCSAYQEGVSINEIQIDGIDGYELQTLNFKNIYNFSKSTGVRGDSWYDWMKRLLENDQIKVKYLDHEDIESLGFECIIDEKYYKVFERGDINDSKLIVECNKWYVGNLLPEPHNEITEHRMVKIYQTEGTPIRVSDGYEGVSENIFRGNIKNKSELKRLLKQLGIDETIQRTT